MTGRTASRVLLAGVVLFVAFQWATRFGPRAFGPAIAGEAHAFLDFDCYAAAAERVRAGLPIYGADPAELPPYVYPPLLAVALVPATLVEHARAEWAWLALNLAACVALVPLLLGALRLPRRPAPLAIALLLVGASMAMFENVALGQVNAMLLALLLLAVRRLDAGDAVAPGTLIALAAVTKIVPVLVGWELVRRQAGRATAAGVLVGAALLVGSFVAAPADGPGDFVRAVSTKSTHDLDTSNNASLLAGLHRAAQPGPAATRALTGLNVLLVLAVGAWGVREARRSREPRWFVALVLALVIAPSPLLEAHHLVFLIPGFLLLALAVRPRERPVAVALRILGIVALAALVNSRGLVPPAAGEGSVAGLLVKPAGVGMWGVIVWLAAELKAGRALPFSEAKPDGSSSSPESPAPPAKAASRRLR